jgi:cysteine synthase A
MNDNILITIGNTPLIRLGKLFRDARRKVYAKLEAFNPGGSIKDRPALNIIRHGIETGEIGPDTVVIESSSGNMGIGLALACMFHGLRFICVVDAKTTAQNLRLLETYGAQVDVITQPDPVTGEYLQARINRVEELMRTVPNGFWPNQYANLYNSHAHRQTMREIVEHLGQVDYLFCTTSTCGTLRGCAEHVLENRLGTKIIAVDAVGSVIFGGAKTKRLIPGHGSSIMPNLFDASLATSCVRVTDLDCIVGCRRLVREEAVLAGGSSGAVVTAIERTLPVIPEGSVCVAIFPDRGERYLDTIYSDAWVEKHFGDVAHQWRKAPVPQTWATMTY